MTGKKQDKRVRLSRETVPKLPPGLHRDTEIPGFACSVSPKGARRFYLLYKRNGVSRRLDLGRFRGEQPETKRGARGVVLDTVTAARARALAEEHRERLDQIPDYDPARERTEERQAAKDAERERRRAAAAAMLTEQAFDEYLKHLHSAVGEEALRPKTIEAIEGSFRVHVLPTLGEILLRDLEPSHIREMFRRASEKRRVGRGKRARMVGGKIAANRALAYLSSFLSWAVHEEIIEANPAAQMRGKEVKRKLRHVEQGRERMLTPDEWTALLRELDEHPYREVVPVGPRVKGRATETRMADEPRLDALLSCEAIRLTLLTGCRRTEALAARWEQFDLRAGVWIKPAWTVKQRRDHRVPLSPDVIERLRLLRKAHTDPVFLFPSPERLRRLQDGEELKGDEGGHQKDVRSLWRQMRERLGLGDVRIHDLRHSYASAALQTGASLIEVRDLLGHSSVRVTERYTHVLDEALRNTTSRVGNFAARGE